MEDYSVEVRRLIEGYFNSAGERLLLLELAVMFLRINKTSYISLENQAKSIGIRNR